MALQIWDIGGQSIGSKMITNYISGAHAILLCYDITNFESFANLEDWYGLVTRTFAGVKRPYLAIVGNKSKLFFYLSLHQRIHLNYTEVVRVRAVRLFNISR